MENNKLAPSAISYSQDSIRDRFDKKSNHRNKYIGETLDDICEGRCTVKNIPKISMMKRNGKWVTADNRRLCVFKQLERLGKCETVPVFVTGRIQEFKMTSNNGGTSVCVRGNPGGRWYINPAHSTSRPPSTSGIAAFCCSRKSPYDRGQTNHFRSVSPTGNRESFMLDTSPSTYAVDTTSPQSVTTAFDSMNATNSTRNTASTEPQRSPNIFATNRLNNAQLNETDRSLQDGRFKFSFCDIWNDSADTAVRHCIRDHKHEKVPFLQFLICDGKVNFKSRSFSVFGRDIKCDPNNVFLNKQTGKLIIPTRTSSESPLKKDEDTDVPTSRLCHKSKGIRITRGTNLRENSIDKMTLIRQTEKNKMRLAPSDISYSQDSISHRFDRRSCHSNTYIGETLDDVCDGRCSVEDIPTISAKKINDKWVTADNRRLWVFKHLERLDLCETVPVCVTGRIPDFKFTSDNGGTSVCVRGNPRGLWYKKPAPPISRPPSSSGGAAFRSIGHSTESTYDRGLGNTFRSVSPTGNLGSFMPNTTTSTFAVDTTSPQSVTTAFSGMNVTKTTRRTASTEPSMNTNIFEFNNTQLYKTDRSLQEFSTPTEEKSKSKCYLVCGIDFGTTYSGWAYSFIDDYEKDPTQSYVRQWHSGSSGLCTEKTPTIALIKPDGRTLLAFGYEAENVYKRLMASNDHEQYYLFRRFKMTLYKKLGEGITRNILLEDELGKQLPAMDIFSMSIKFLADDLKKNIRQKVGGHMDHLQIDWVITVPAIWTDAAKQFMREAATQAGISPERLTLALEPEAASLFCRHLKNDNIVGDDDAVVHRPRPGSKYLIFDAGGGTVDLTLHQIGTSDTLREVKPACGADCGGTMVDKAFEKLMIDIVGVDVYTKFRTTETDEFMDFQRVFELKKRAAGRTPSARVAVRIPPALIQIYYDETNRQLGDAVAKSRYSDYIVLDRDNLRFDANCFASLFEESVTKALDQVKQILQNEDLSAIHAIYMVGGYSQSPLLQKRMKDAYPTLNVVIPHDASMCVLKGALIYGHNPTMISERVLKYTYGIESLSPFDQNLHPIAKLYENDEGSYCKDIFSIHAKKGQTVHIGTMQKRHTYGSAQIHQQSLPFPLYASDKESPLFVDEQGCRKIGETRLVLQKPCAKKYPTSTVCLTFSGTEIFVEAVEDATGQKITCNMNFLG